MLDEDSRPNYGNHSPRPSNAKQRELEELVNEAASAKSLAFVFKGRMEKELATYKDLEENRIPQLMRECGLDELKTSAGMRVEIKSDLFANLPSPTSINDEKDSVKRQHLIERRTQGIEWLEKNGHAAYVKRSFKIEFDKDQTDKAEEFKKELLAREDPLYMVEGADVNANSLRALLKALQKKGKTFPQDVFAAYPRTFAVVSYPKAKHGDD